MSDKILNEVTSRIVLDMKTLEERAQHLPPAMREDFVWLGSYTREECGRDVDILHNRLKALGIHHDKTTWSKILRGLWNRTPEGRDTAAPCLAEEKFLKAVRVLRNDARVKEQGGRIPFVETPTALDIFNYIDAKRAPDRICKFGVIIGETGLQKTASLKEYCRRNNHGSCVIVEAPETASMSQFMTDLAKCYGYSAQANYLRKKTFVLECVNEKKTIIIENIQRLYDARHQDKQVIFSFLQKLQEDTGCTIILSFTTTFEKVFIGGLQRGFFEQFVGRAGGQRTFLRLPAYPPEDDVVMIAQAFGLQQAEKHADYLVKIAHEDGRIRRLFEDLQEAKIEAEANKEKLTINHIRAARGED
jgi:hypothetical protein